MKLLEERIRKDGEVLDGNVLKINSFLNHQVDPQLMMEVGKEFKRLFENEKVTKVLTCEASGIAPGIMAAYQLGVPMVLRERKNLQLLMMLFIGQMYFPTLKNLTIKFVLKRNS